MNVLMVTPHLPPHQAANALLPELLGQGLEARGHSVRYLTFGDAADTERIVRVARRARTLRATRLPQLLEAIDTWRKLRPLLSDSDVLHVHSNTWMNQVAAVLAVRAGRPYVLTHYGTEIWHHDGRDRRFRRLNRQASHVAYYSRALLDRGRELGVPCRAASVIYPPVAETFGPMSPGRREEIRRRFVETDGLLLLNVKRLHPLADHVTLLAAFAHVIRQRPEARLLIAGSGERETRLRAQAAALGLEASVRFLGLVPNEEVAELQAAADLFVLSSMLEATPTVVLEALASGTPAVSTDNPGGLELHALFGDDVTVVPRSSPEPLAEAILTAAAGPRRTRPETARRIEERFRPHAVVTAYAELYREALGT